MTEPLPADNRTERSATIAEELRALIVRSNGVGLSTQEILDVMATRGIALLMVLFAAPFLIPISIPGTSTPFGLMLCVLGATMVLNRPPWVPGFLGKKRVPHKSLERVVAVLLRFFTRLERWLHVRHEFWVRQGTMMRLHGIYIAGMAVVLALPLPPFPFFASNTIAAWPIFLLGLGLLERDGVFVGLAYAWLLPFFAYWVVLAVVSREAFVLLIEYWGMIEAFLQQFWFLTLGRLF